MSQEHHWKYSHRRYPKYNIWKNAKARATKYDLPFSITQDDFEIPTHCPVLGIELYHNYDGKRGSRIDNSPTLDRIVPELGYVPGNVLIVSRKANLIKSNATVEEIGMVFAFYQTRIIQHNINRDNDNNHSSNSRSINLQCPIHHSRNDIEKETQK